MAKIEYIIISGALIIVSGLTLNVGLIIGSLFLKSNDLFYITLFTLTFLVSFILLPTIIVKLITRKSFIHIFNNIVNIKRLIILMPVTFIVSLLLTDLSTTLQYLVVAMGEEYLFRHLIFLLLKEKFSKIYTYIIGSILFACVLHINDNLLSNLLIRFPSSIIFYYLADRYRLQDSIALHWFYNVIVTKLVS